MYKILTIPLFLHLLFFANQVNAQNVVQDICLIKDGKIVFRLNRTWNDSIQQQVAKDFSLDTSIIKNAFRLEKSFLHDSVLWQISVIDEHIVELSKVIDQYRYSEKDKYQISMPDPIIFSQIQPVLPSNVSFGKNSFKNKSAFSYNISDSTATFFFNAPGASKDVVLSGCFNDWSTSDYQMHKTDSGWVYSVKLSPGKYEYKYIVDGLWTTDPNNKTKAYNIHGTDNSVVFCPNKRFIYKSIKKIKKVELTGNFTGWTPKGIPFEKTGNIWILDIYFADGTYTYKFIVNRKEWLLDPENPSTKDDGTGIVNSLLEIGEKHVFKLNAFRDAQNVILSGSFNYWNTNQWNMKKTDAGWVLPFVIAKGNHEYKFIVDGVWHIDPENPVTNGSDEVQNSVLSIQPNHTFNLNGYENARKVCVSGSFNGWSQSGYTMIKNGNTWTLPVYLEKGKHLYKFIVDGTWIADSGNPLWEPNEFGEANSIIWMP